MKFIKSLAFTIAFALALPLAAFAKVPWGAQSNGTGQSPVCTSFSTDPVCVVTLSTTQASVTISGGTAGSFYTLVWMENGTGGYPITLPTNLTAATSYGTLPSAIPTAANNWSVWVVQAVGATPTYQLVSTYDELPLNDVFTSTVATLGTAVTTGTYQLQPSVIVPGA